MGGVTEQVRSDDSVTLPAHLPVHFTCDGCSARAIYEAQLPSGKTLILCGHHTNRHMDALVTAGASIFPLENE